MKMKKENLKIKLMALGGVVGLCLFTLLGIKKMVQALEIPANTMETEIQSENNNPDFRIMNGNYHDYKIVVTIDGNMWFINEEYQEEELLQVLFDTNKTSDIKDDKIVNIRSIDKRYNE